MDIDIDFPISFNLNKIIPDWTKASTVRNGELVPHPCGYYPQTIPLDKITNLSAIPYDSAEAEGFNKIDFLHVHIYDYIANRKELEQLAQIDPNWDLLLVPSIQVKLFQLSKHGDMLNIIKPKNIEELADVLALIRPGKKNLVNLYKSQKDTARRLLYAKDDEGYTFKKSHAIAYAMLIVIQLHLIESGIL